MKFTPTSGGSVAGPRYTTPLPTFWPLGRRFRGRRIDLLPPDYRRWALRSLRLPPPLRAALRAADAFRQMADDQQRGHH